MTFLDWFFASLGDLFYTMLDRATDKCRWFIK